MGNLVQSIDAQASDGQFWNMMKGLPPFWLSIAFNKQITNKNLQNFYCMLQKKVEEKKGKQRGPLPMTIAQLLMLGVFGGIGYVTILKEEELNRVLASIGAVVGKAFSNVGSSSKKAVNESNPWPWFLNCLPLVLLCRSIAWNKYFPSMLRAAINFARDHQS